MSGIPWGGGGTPAPAPSGDSTSSGSSASSSSSSSSGPSAEAQQFAHDQAVASYRDVLRRWGMVPSKNLLNLIDKAILGNWTTTYFLDRLRHTPEYQQKFIGIAYKDGMSEATYNATYASYRDRAKDVGVNLDRKEFAKLLKRGVDSSEFNDRVDAIASIDKWGPMWGYFTAALEARGLAPKGVTKKDLADLVMGLGNKQWEKVYDETFLTAGLERVAGIQVGGSDPTLWAEDQGQNNGLGFGDYAITRQDLLTLVKQAESLHMGFDPAKLDYAKIGTTLRQFKPAYLAGYGITTKDIVEMELSGPRAAAIAERAQRLLATQNAFNEPRATPQSAANVGQGTPSTPQQL